MGTRGVIGRKTPTGFSGRYHHWDSYPEGLGSTLYEAYNGFFKKDLDKMLTFLIDKHKAGWSTICGKDFSKKAGWIDYDERKKDADGNYIKTGPECYCHGGRKEKEWMVTEKNASDSGAEWAYIFDKFDMMHVLSSRSLNKDGKQIKMIGMFGCGDPDATWYPVVTVDLNGAEPDWKAIQEAG